MGAGVALMILALLLRGLGTIENGTTTGSIFVIGLALFLLGLLTWLYLFRPWARFDDLKTPHYTGEHAHGESHHAQADQAEAHGDEAVLVAEPAAKAAVPVAVPEPKTAIEPHVIQVPAPKAETVADVAGHVGEAAQQAVKDAAAAVKKAAEAAAPAKAGEPAEADDLTLIEGIGPKTNAALQAAGIKTFEALSRMAPNEIAALLSAAKVRIVSPPDTWPEQARLAAAGDMDGLRALQSRLKGGILKD